MKIVVSGATGFLGGALSKYWANAGHEVTALIREISSEKRPHLESIGANVRCFKDATDLRSIFQDVRPSAVVHTACSYGRANETVAEIFDANVALGVALLDAAAGLENGCHFINTGTVLNEDTNYYALTKCQFSQWSEKVVVGLGAPVKYTNVLLQHMYGPHDAASKFTTHVLRTCRSNAPRLELTKGEQLRDFIFINDAVRAYDTVLQNAASLAKFEHLQVGSGKAVRIRDFVEMAHAMTHSSTELIFGAIPYREKDANCYVADITRLATLGWKPQYTLEDGIHATLSSELT
jgi:CDP-paratose synthetase